MNLNFSAFADIRFLKFLFLGLLNTIVGFVSMILFDGVFGEDSKALTLFLSYVVVFFFGHSVSRALIWKSRNRYWREFARYFFSYWPSLIPSIVAFFVFSLWLKYNYIYVQAAISISTAGVVFIIQKLRVFDSPVKNKAVFLDRDGVINELVGRQLERGPRDVSELSIRSDVLELITKCEELGYICLVVTNQPDISRGLMSKTALLDIHNRIAHELPGIKAFYTCEHDNDDNCVCRKPEPGLLIRAQKDYDLNLSRSYFVGDRWTDVSAAHRAGVRSVLLRNARSDYAGSQGFKPKYLKADYEINGLMELLRIIS